MGSQLLDLGGEVPVQGAIESVGGELPSDVAAGLPDGDASVRLTDRLGGPSVITGDQWRVLARVGAGRRVSELAAVLALGDQAAGRVVLELVHAGLVEVVRAPALLTAPPTGPALPPPAAPTAEITVLVDDEPIHDRPVDDEPAHAGTGAQAPWQPEASLAASEASWVPDAPSSGDDWLEPDPFVASPTLDWDGTGVAPTGAAPAWDHTPAPPVRSTWSDDAVATFEARAVATGAFAGARAAGGADTRADDAPVDHAVSDDEPDLPVLIDDTGASAESDDELVNRALLFKFLSSVRE